MLDTELTVLRPIVFTVAREGLDFNALVAAIRQAAAPAFGDLLDDRISFLQEHRPRGRRSRAGNAADSDG